VPQESYLVYTGNIGAQKKATCGPCGFERILS